MFKKTILISILAAALVFVFSNIETHTLKASPKSFASQGNLSDTAVDKPAEEVYKNIQVIKGMPSSKVHIAMRFMAFSLGVRCNYCHVTAENGPWPLEKDDKETKLTARKMITMMNDINRDNFEGRQEVNCATCHNGSTKPGNTPPLFREPTEVAVSKDSLPDVTTILDKYVNAIGGKAAFEKMKSRITNEELTMNDGSKMQAEILQTSPDKYLATVTSKDGIFINGYNGKIGWLKDPRRQGEMEAEELASIKRDAVFNQEIKLGNLYSKMKVRGISLIDNHKAYQVSGAADGDNYVRLYFDTESGLLLRSIFYDMNPIGAIPEETNYNDYRDIDGVKIPYSLSIRGANFVQMIKVSGIKNNAAIDDAKFDMPPK